MDAGAHGVMYPLLRTAADAREIVNGAKYPPLGSRGFGPMYTHHAFGPDCTPQEYKEGAGNIVSSLFTRYDRTAITEIGTVRARPNRNKGSRP